MMRVKLTGFLFTSMLVVAPFCYADENRVVFPVKEWKEATPESQGLDSARLDKAMEYIKKISKHQGNSQSIVIRNGYMVWKGSDIDNKHTIYSCTKSFTNAVLGLLVGDGRLSLDDPLSQYVPELKKLYPTATIRHFANFTSGYAYEKKNSLIPLKPLHEPGTMFKYSRATDQIAQALTLIAGESMYDIFKRRVADPIGMDTEAWSWGTLSKIDGLTINGGAGGSGTGIEITAREIARFGLLFLNNGRWNNKQIISESFVRESTKPQTSAETLPYKPNAWYKGLPGAYGLNWWVNGITATGKRLWPSAPPGTFAAQGKMNNYCFVIPEWNMVVVRLGTDSSINSGLYDGFFALMQKAFL